MLQSGVFSGSIVFWMMNLNHNPISRYFIFVGILWLLYFNSYALGVLMVGLFPNPATLLATSPLFWILHMLFAGFYIAGSTIPVFLRWISNINFVAYGLRALLVNEFEGGTLTTQPPTLFPNGVCVYVFIMLPDVFMINTFR